MSPLAGYYFIPAVRRGLSATISQEATGARAQLQANIRVKAEGATPLEAPFPATVKLYGPGDIVGFDPAIVTRTDPRANVGDFEPNYFPLVEFAESDFPWRYTARPATQSGLMPWITLVVLERAEFDDSDFKKNVKSTKDPEVPWIKVLAAGSLPDPTQAWRWAHVQVTGEQDLSVDAAGLTTAETKTPERVVSRLICPRHLKPGVAYSAFVVPTFKLGCVAARRATAVASDTALTPAWAAGSGAPVELPYYYRWDFHTGLRGDFEYLVRLLQPRTLGDLGLRPMDCSAPGFGMKDKAGVLDLEGALKSIGIKYTAWGADRPGAEPLFQGPLAGLLNKLAADLQPLVTDISIPVTVPPQVVTQLRATFTLAGAAAQRDVRLSWNTQQPVPCRVVGGLTSSVTPVGTSHVVVLSGLLPGKSYAFQIQCTPPLGPLTPRVTLNVPALGQFPLPTVVPPIYGHWHAGRPTVKMGSAAWVDQLNLDPRHRAAAGFGALVIEQQQEPLMASAWDQIGDIDEANQVLRQAQMGREAAHAIHQRISLLADERFMLASRSVQHRLRMSPPRAGNPTVARVLETRIPRALLDPAFRRIQRTRGALARRRGLLAPVSRPNLLARLNSRSLMPAGPVRDVEGMRNFYDATRIAAKTFNLAVPESSADIRRLNLAAITSTPLAGSLGGLAASLGAPHPLNSPLGTSPLPVSPVGGPVAAPVAAPTSGPTSLGGTAIGSTPTMATGIPTGFFHPALITGRSVTIGLNDPRTLQGITLPTGLNVSEVASGIAETLDGWLAPVPSPNLGEAPAVDLTALTGMVKAAVDPRTTIPRRIRQRLRLVDELAGRAQALEQLVASPEFPQPMYEALRDMSQDLVLPGLDRVPQNTLAVLETNGRFVEAYMVALNHCFSGELLWRGAPVSGRSTYFRQFWDVEAVLPTDDEIAAEAELNVAANAPDRTAKVQAEAERLERTYREPLKDVKPLHLWGTTPLGSHDNRASSAQEEQLVLLVRGDLLKKYPNTLVYAVPAVGTPTQRDPGLPEFLTGTSPTPPAPILPVFSGSLSPDLTFFGFPFTAAQARADPQKYPLGVYFVLEERVSEARFGVDVPDGPTPVLGGKAADPEDDWDNLSWAHLPGVAEGQYVDGAAPAGAAGLTPQWNVSSATIASITFQKPVRIAVHADQMLPK